MALEFLPIARVLLENLADSGSCVRMIANEGVHREHSFRGDRSPFNFGIRSRNVPGRQRVVNTHASHDTRSGVHRTTQTSAISRKTLPYMKRDQTGESSRKDRGATRAELINHLINGPTSTIRAEASEPGKTCRARPRGVSPRMNDKTRRFPSAVYIVSD